MIPAPPAARRPLPLGCVLAAAAALALSACGGGGAATAESTAASQRTASQPAAHAPAARPCPASLDALVRSLDHLRSRLAAGLSYEQYAAGMGALRISYDSVPVAHLTIDCLASTGTPAEKALNKYIDAANTWGECLADASCTTASVEPVLQRKWRLASDFLSQAQ
jgi:hypothetical protein